MGHILLDCAHCTGKQLFIFPYWSNAAKKTQCTRERKCTLSTLSFLCGAVVPRDAAFSPQFAVLPMLNSSSLPTSEQSVKISEKVE